MFGKVGGEWSKKWHECALVVGMRGGKNTIAETITDFVCYFIKCLRDPHDFFSKLTGRIAPYKYTLDKNFDIVNVSSVSGNQAQLAFFDTMKNVIKLTKDPGSGENWFEKFAKMDLREGFGDIKGNIVTFPTDIPGKGTIRLMTFNSEAKAPEGMHMLIYLADELSRADTKAAYKEATKLLNLGLNNTRISFPHRVGKVLGWSYPNDSMFDLTYERYEKSFTAKTIFGRKYTTLEFNPSLGKEALVDAYDTDPITCKRVYECIKPTSKSNFYQPYVEKIKEAIDYSIENKIKYKLKAIRRKTKDGSEYEFTGIELLDIIGDNRYRCFAADPSKIKDRFVIVGGYNETIDPLKYSIFTNDHMDVYTTNVKPIIDIIIVIEPMQGKPIDSVAIGNIFNAIIKNYPNTYSINSDHYQGEKIRQEIIEHGIKSEAYFFSNEKQVRLYLRQRANIWGNNIAICADETNEGVIIGSSRFKQHELFIHESEHLIYESNKIDHPENGGSKDLTDAVAICVNDLLDLEALGYEQSNPDTLSEEKFRQLVDLFMTEKEKLLQQDTPETEILQIIANRLRISLTTANNLAKFVQEVFNY
jgi:hypothetical protein